MLEILEGFEPSTIALRASGEVTREDYHDILIPRVKEILEEYDKVNCMMLITDGTTYTAGALATDAAFGLSHMFSWHRIAIVSDIQWVHKAAGYFLPLMPFEIKLFSESDYDAAKAWLEA